MGFHSTKAVGTTGSPTIQTNPGGASSSPAILRHPVLSFTWTSVFLRRTVAVLLMDAGVLSYSASTGQQRVVPHPSVGSRLKGLLLHTGPMVLTNLALLGVLAALGHGWLYLAWVPANATTFSLFLRARLVDE